MVPADPTAFLDDLIAAFGGKPRTKYELERKLIRRYAIDTSVINQWLYRYEGSLFAKDRSPQEGLPTWWVIPSSRPVPVVVPTTAAGPPIAIRPERWERLRDWQREAIDAWLENDRWGIVEAVTGAGKSDVGIALAEDALASGGRVLVIVANNMLKAQWAKRLREDVCDQLGVDVAEILKTPSWAWRRARVMIAGPMTVERAIATGRLDPSTVSLVIADEVHHLGAAKWRAALNPSFGSGLGLSATIERSEPTYRDVLEPYFDDIVYELGFTKAYGHGLLAPFRMAYVGCAFSEAEQAEYDEATQRYSSARKRLLKLFPDLKGVPSSEFFAQVAQIASGAADRESGIVAQVLMKALTAQRDLRASCSGKLRALPEVLQVAAHREKGLVFTDTKRAAGQALDACAFAGVVGAMITADTPMDERPGILREFERGEVRVLTAPKVLDEGLDVPSADFGIVVSASRSRRQMIQRFGRLLRQKPGGGDAAIVVLYVVGTNEDPAHPIRDGFIEDLEDLATPGCELFDADRDMGRLLDFLLP